MVKNVLEGFFKRYVDSSLAVYCNKELIDEGMFFDLYYKYHPNDSYFYHVKSSINTCLKHIPKHCLTKKLFKLVKKDYDSDRLNKLEK